MISVSKKARMVRSQDEMFSISSSFKWDINQVGKLKGIVPEFQTIDAYDRFYQVY